MREPAREEGEKKKRGGKILALVLTVVFLAGIGAALWLLKPVSFRVSGNRFSDRNAVLSLVFPKGEDTRYLDVLLRMTFLRVREDAFSSVRVVPESLQGIRVEVSEKNAAACLVQKNGNLILTPDGAVLCDLPMAPEGLMKLEGVEIAEYTLFGRVPEANRTEVADLLTLSSFAEQNRLPGNSFGIRNGQYYLTEKNVTVIVGTMENCENKLMLLRDIGPAYENLEGVLHLEHYRDPDDPGAVYFSVGEIFK